MEELDKELTKLEEILNDLENYLISKNIDALSSYKYCLLYSATLAVMNGLDKEKFLIYSRNAFEISDTNAKYKMLKEIDN